MAYDRRSFSAVAVATTLATVASSTDTTLSISSSTNWPDGSGGRFYALIDEGTSSEEKVLVTTRSGTTLQDVFRGQDGTNATAHSAGASIRVFFAALDLNEANYWVSELAGAASAVSDLIVAEADNSLTQIAKGSNSTVLGVSAAGTLGYATVTSAQITDSTIVNGDINASAAIALTKFASIADQTVLGNVSGSSAAPSALALTPSTVLRKTSNQTISVGDGVVAVSGLGFTAADGVPYWVDAALVYTGSTSATQSFHFTSGLEGALAVTTIDTGAALQNDVVDLSGFVLADISSSSTTKRTVHARGWLVGEGATCEPSFIAATDPGFHPPGTYGPITIYAGSYLRYRALT